MPTLRSPTQHLALLYSGGAGNSSALNSIGGPASATAARYIHSQSYTASTIAGVEITHAARNSIGPNGYLQYTASNKTFTWTTHTGSVASVSVEASGWYVVGTTTNGYLRLYIDFSLLLPYDVGQYVAIASAMSTLFAPPAANELISGVTEYRALYLANQSTISMRDVLLTSLVSLTTESMVHLGSTFIPISTYATPKAEGLTFGGFNFVTGTSPYVTGTTPSTKRERLIYTTPNGQPRFIYYPPDQGQSSNGVDTDIEPAIQDRYDSTGKLATVSWGNTLQWSEIPAGRMVSFWLRRVLPPNPTVPLLESVDLDITLTLY